MIYFQKLSYKNFLSVGTYPVEIDFTKNKLTAISGKSGSGKSTILDAITFALFGKAYRPINKGGLVNTINKKECEVEILFSIHNIQYKVKRGISPNFFEIEKDGNILDSVVVTDQQKLLENEIGMNYKIFKQIIVLGATDFTSFMALKPSDRRLFIEKLLDIEVFSYMAKKVAEDISENKKEIVSIEKDISSTETLIENQKKTLVSIEHDEKNKEKEIAEKIKKEEEKLQKLSKMFLEEIPCDKELLKKIEKKESEINSAISVLNSRKREIEKHVAFYKDNNSCNTCRQVIGNEIKTKVLEKGSTEFEKINVQLDDLLKKSQYCKTKKSEVKKQIESSETIQRKNIEIKNDIKYIERNIKNLQESSKNVFNNSKKEIKESISEYEKKLDRSRKVFSNLSKEKDILSIAKKVVADDGVKSKIVEQYVPLINKHMNIFLNAMDFFVTFELDSEFNESIKSRGRDKFTYANFSEGEKQRIDLAILLTWRKISQAKNSLSTNLLVLDEVFDSYLNIEATQNVLEMFKKNFDASNNILVISHKEAILEEFDSVIKFEKDNNFSRTI